MTSSMTAQCYDIAVVGAGIVGLALAGEAAGRGLRVAVIERDDQAAGASVRNFGHGCFTAQSGLALQYAMASRATWLQLAKAAGFWLAEAGTAVLACSDAEVAVLEEFTSQRPGQVLMLTQEGVARLVPCGPQVLGGSLLPLDVRVDPREAIPAITRWLEQQAVDFYWRTNVLGAGNGAVETSRGGLRADRVVVAAGHDVGRLYPDHADQAGLQRCQLHMLQVAMPGRPVIDPAVLSGTSLLRYGGFASCPSLSAVRERIGIEQPELLAAGVNLMLTQRPDGDLVIGDTHTYAGTLSPFRDEDADDLILRHIARLLGLEGPSRLRVRQRWEGVYASSSRTDYLNVRPDDAVQLATVTTGIGMTTAFGFAAAVLDTFLA